MYIVGVSNFDHIKSGLSMAYRGGLGLGFCSGNFEFCKHYYGFCEKFLIFIAPGYGDHNYHIK